MAGGLCLCPVAWLQPGVQDLTVFVVREPDGAVVAPIPAVIGDDGLHAAVGAGDLQLGQKLGLEAVLIFESPGTGAAPIPAVCQLHR